MRCCFSLHSYFLHFPLNKKQNCSFLQVNCRPSYLHYSSPWLRRSESIFGWVVSEFEFTVGAHMNACTRTQRKEKCMELAPEQTNEAVACMTGAECQCQRALCSLGLVFSLNLHKVSVLQNDKCKLNDFQL